MKATTNRRLSGLALVGDMTLPITSEVYRLAALHRERGYAGHLIAIRDAAVIFAP